MLYHLFICRHAQAQSPAFNQRDIERRLTETGIREAQQAGQWLRHLGYVPDIIFCSSADRTLDTARIIAAEIDYNPKNILSTAELYDASVWQLLSTVSQINNQSKTALLVGHNPGVTELTAALSGRFKGSAPTGSVHHVWFEMGAWSEIMHIPSLGYETNRS